ncbi:MAG: 50S ribosomal protein L24 [Thermoflexus sp.]|uniref:50S ribosomal protein L24 n=1 Tax=Thermoflexus sp. TaxID=1969742 RepID=UPI00331EA610
MAAKIKKGDKVLVIAGDDRGAQGEVLRVLPKEGRVVVSGVNIVKKHQRPRPTGRSQVGGIIAFEAPIHISNVMLICPKCNRPTRVGFTVEPSGRKVRQCKKCQATFI